MLLLELKLNSCVLDHVEFQSNVTGTGVAAAAAAAFVYQESPKTQQMEGELFDNEEVSGVQELASSRLGRTQQFGQERFGSAETGFGRSLKKPIAIFTYKQ